MRIVVVGFAVKGSRTRQRIKALSGLGHDVHLIDTAPTGRTYETKPTLGRRIRHRVRRPVDETGANHALLAADDVDLIWIENASMIRPATLQALRVRKHRPRIVWYSEDDMMRPLNGSVWLDRNWPLFDLCVTTKSFNAVPQELPSKGARRVLFVNNSFDPEVHRPAPADDETRARFGADVSFVGTYEAPRAASMLHLAQNGIEVRIWGNGWRAMKGAHPLLRVEDRPVYDYDYARVTASSRINLGFLRKANRDRQTTRSIELPACGAFMLHEYSDEMATLLTPGVHAAYFRDDAELLAACRYWLSADQERCRVAQAGYARVHAAGLRHHDMLDRAIAVAMTDDGNA